MINICFKLYVKFDCQNVKEKTEKNMSEELFNNLPTQIIYQRISHKTVNNNIKIKIG